EPDKPAPVAREQDARVTLRRDFDEPPTVERQLPEGWPLLATLSEPRAASDPPAADTVRPPPPQPEPAATAPPPLPPPAMPPPARSPPAPAPWPGLFPIPAHSGSPPPEAGAHYPRRPLADRTSPVPVAPLLIAEVVESAAIVRAEPDRMVAVEETG